MGNLDIRRAELTDIPAIADLVGQYWQFEGIDGYDRARITAVLETAILNEQLGTVFVALSEGNCVGYVVAFSMLSIEYGGVAAEIDELFIVSNFRGDGLGQRLIEALERRLKEQGCRYICMRVARENAKAEHFYQRLGYVRNDDYQMFEKMIL
jgi:ribosomal protein S18 acetylase RimI-like enzyme